MIISDMDTVYKEVHAFIHSLFYPRLLVCKYTR